MVHDHCQGNLKQAFGIDPLASRRQPLLRNRGPGRYVLAVGRREQTLDRDRTPGNGDEHRDHAPAASGTKREGDAVHDDLEPASTG
jgi:hypothetical protein